MAPVEGSNEIEFVDRGTGFRADRGRHASEVVGEALPCWLHALEASERLVRSSCARHVFLSAAAAGEAWPLGVWVLRPPRGPPFSHHSSGPARRGGCPSKCA